MSREQVLEDILRGRAVDVSPDPDALAAILNAPNPNSKDQRRLDQSAGSAATASPPGSASSVATGTSATGGSFFGKLAKFVAGGVVTVVVGTLAYAGVAGTTTHCPGLGRVNDYVNDKIIDEGAEDQGVDIPCNSDTLDFSDVKSSAPNDIHDDLDANQAQIEEILDCINEAATPLSLGSLFDKIPDICLGQLSVSGN